MKKIFNKYQYMSGLFLVPTSLKHRIRGYKKEQLFIAAWNLVTSVNLMETHKEFYRMRQLQKVQGVL